MADCEEQSERVFAYVDEHKQAICTAIIRYPF